MRLLVLMLAAAALTPRVVAADRSLADGRDTLQPFLNRYCVSCHGEDEQNGQVRFDNVLWEITTNDTAQRWQDVLDQLNGGDMPPADAEQPSTAELAAALDELTAAVLEARRRLTDHGGEITLRRLNKREYSNTIEHLFGFGVAADDIPDDGQIATFDTVGSEQFFTSSHFEKYLELGRKVAFESFRFNLGPRRPVTTERTQPETRHTQKLRDKLADLDRQMAMKQAGAGWKEMGFRDEGEMEIIFRQWDSRAEMPRRYLQYPLVDSGVYISDAVKWASAAMHTDIRGEYIIRIHGGIEGDPHPLRRIVRVWGRHSIRGTLELAGTPAAPQTVEMRAHQQMGRSHLAVNVRENAPLNTQNTLRGYISRLDGKGDRIDPRPAVYIDWIELEGPYYPQQRPAWEDILFPHGETGVSQSPYLWNPDRMRELIEKFAYEAFRHRTPEPEYVAALHAMYEQNVAAGMNGRDALVEVMAIVLASPAFLFHHEGQPQLVAGTASPAVAAGAEATANAGEATATAGTAAVRGALSNRELAVRLSYFLWSAPPDPPLYAADLSDPAVFAAQVDRLLADPRARAFSQGFASQWAEFERYDAITVDNRQHHHFNEGVQQDAKREVVEFFHTLVQDNLPVENLIDADFVVINAALARHYGMDFPATASDDFRRVQVPADSPRGGLMTQAAFLTMGSNGERSSPVIRGALVMEKLLHDAPAPPPPNVPELSAASDAPKTNREMVQLHQQQAVCASCHRKMDVIGFGLENFDTTGRWRDTESVGRRRVAIDPSGTLPSGASFDSVRQLKQVLLAEKEALAQELVESVLSYGLGRTIEFSDGDDVQAIMESLRGDEFRLRSLIREVACAPLFRRR